MYNTKNDYIAICTTRGRRKLRWISDLYDVLPKVSWIHLQGEHNKKLIEIFSGFAIVSFYMEVDHVPQRISTSSLRNDQRHVHL